MALIRHAQIYQVLTLHYFVLCLVVRPISTIFVLTILFVKIGLIILICYTYLSHLFTINKIHFISYLTNLNHLKLWTAAENHKLKWLKIEENYFKALKIKMTNIIVLFSVTYYKSLLLNIFDTSILTDIYMYIYFLKYVDILSDD